MKFVTMVALLALWVPQSYSQIITNDENLFDLANRDIRGVQPATIHQENLINLKKFIDYDVTLIDSRLVNDSRPQYLDFSDAKRALRAVDVNPVVSLNQYSKYDPNNEGIGFCFGRAMFLHLELVQRGLDTRSVQKAFVVGDMQTFDGAKWGWHVTTIAQSINAQGKEIWLAIDPIVGQVIELEQWYNLMRNSYSVDKRLKFYITHPTRLGPHGTYDEDHIRITFYNKYFTDMMNWFDSESRAGRYNTPLRKR